MVWSLLAAAALDYYYFCRRPADYEYKAVLTDGSHLVDSAPTSVDVVIPSETVVFVFSCSIEYRGALSSLVVAAHHAIHPGGGNDKQGQHRRAATASEVWTVEGNSVLVLEDLKAGGGLVGFCGAVGPQLGSPTAATTTSKSTLDARIFVRQDCEIDSSTTSLLVRSLHGWLAGPAAAAAAAKQITARAAMTRSRRAGLAAGAGGAGRREEMEEQEGGGAGDEMVDWVDTKGRVICALPRPMVHSNNVLHRGAGVMIRNSKARRYYCCTAVLLCFLCTRYLVFIDLKKLIVRMSHHSTAAPCKALNRMRHRHHGRPVHSGCTATFSVPTTVSLPPLATQ